MYTVTLLQQCKVALCMYMYCMHLKLIIIILLQYVWMVQSLEQLYLLSSLSSCESLVDFQYHYLIGYLVTNLKGKRERERGDNINK